SIGGRRPHDSDGLDLRARRSPALVAPSTAPNQRAHGNIRHLVVSYFVSRPSLVANPNYHTRVRHWGDYRFHETDAHSFESAQCALVPSRTRHRRGLRNLPRARLAKDA